MSNYSSNNREKHPLIEQLSDAPNPLWQILSRRKISRDGAKLLLIEHAESELDAADEARGIEKVRKGGATLQQRTSASILFKRKELSIREVLAMIREEHPWVRNIGLDPHLSERGIGQSERLGVVLQELMNHDMLVQPGAHRDSRPYSSPSERATQTTGFAGLGWSPHELEELMERIMSAGHGLTTKQFLAKFPQLRAAFEAGENLVHPGIENESRFRQRIISALRTIMFETAHLAHQHNKTWTPVVTHQTVIKDIVQMILNFEAKKRGMRPINPYTDIPIGNTSVTPVIISAIDRNSMQGQVLTINHAEHLMRD